MRTRAVVLDFDGTFTDVEREGAPFTTKFRSMVADLLGRAIDREWERALAELMDRPEAHGWEIDGRIVAPATSDPYLRATAAAQRIFDHVGVLADRPFRTDVLQVLYRTAYRESRIAFRAEARDVLDALLGRDLPVYVVTNSDPELVSKKLDALGLARRAAVRLIGDAKKFVVGALTAPHPAFDRVPERDAFAQLDARSIYVRRPRYFEALQRVCTETGATFEELFVAGDVYELDLALPLALGGAVHLVTRDGTPAFEKRAIESAGLRASHSDSLRGVLERLEG